MKNFILTKGDNSSLFQRKEFSLEYNHKEYKNALFFT